MKLVSFLEYLRCSVIGPDLETFEALLANLKLGRHDLAMEASQSQKQVVAMNSEVDLNLCLQNRIQPRLMPSDKDLAHPDLRPAIHRELSRDT